MTSPSPSPPTFELCDEEAFVFDAHPELFVLLDVEPIIFTTRGVRYFGPRFCSIGIDPARITSAGDFHAAERQWMQVERVLLQDQIAARAGATHTANEHQILQAIMLGDIDAAEQALHRLDHKQRAKLSVVGRDEAS